MDIHAYVEKVKTFQQSELLSTLVTLEVRANDLINMLDQLKSNNIDLSKPMEQWIVTRGLEKHLHAQGYRDTSIIHAVGYGAQGIKTLVTHLNKIIIGYNEKIWDGKLITLKQANILNLIEYMNYWLKYSVMVFDVLVTMHNEHESPERYLNKGDLRWIMGTEAFYRSFTADLMKGTKYFLSNLDKIPDVEISEGTLTVLEGLDDKENKTTLLEKGFGIHTVNPYFWYALGKSQINLMRIEQMRRNNELFAMKIAKAINQRDGTNDPQIDRRIEVYQEAILRNENAIEHIEASYA